MKRTENTYEIDGKRVKLTIGGVHAIFELALLPLIKTYHWCYRGKGVIKNEFGETLCGRIAMLYNFDADEYTRRVCNDDYTYDNYTTRTAAAIGRISGTLTHVAHVVHVPHDRTPHDDMGVPRLQRIKYTNKYQCETVTLAVKTGGTINGTINVKINTFCRRYIPSIVRVSDFRGKPDVLTVSGLPLRIWLQEELDEEADIRDKYGITVREDPFDFRVDPNDLTYIARREDRIRYHYIDDGIVLEIQENYHNTFRGWPAVQAESHQFRVPVCNTKHKPRRLFIIIDERVLDYIEKVWYNPHIDEFLVWDRLSKVDKKRPLKRLVCEVAGIRTENVYIAPRLNTRYKDAMEKSVDVSTQEGILAARRIAHYENKLHTSNRGNMFTKPRYIKRMKILAEKEYFCTEIYDGVGVWCLDMRAASLRLPGSQAPERLTTHRKGVRE
jgi:hypothetical protein